MSPSRRRLLMMLGFITIGSGALLLIRPELLWLAWLNIGCGLAIVAVASGGRQRIHAGPREDERIGSLPIERRRELVRGTSLYLRELHYRYSIRIDPNETSERRCFSAEVNSVKLGFVPVIIIDNTSDRQGHGFVAFVYDGNRWRGPGLPCPAGQVEAVRHAAKCVSPLAREEETRFEESTQY